MNAYLRDGPMPYCKGCGHALVARRLADALGTLAVDPRDVVLTTDIGCVGLVDPLFPAVHTVHTIHGRSTAIATGAVLADRLLAEGRVRNIVMLGDGGASIGLLHLTQAALLNVDLTVLVHNNMLYGMTGGQHSALTPEGFATSTTPRGNWVPAIDLEQLLRGCHAGFFARALATDHDLGDVIADAITYPGFAAVEILELCVGYGVPLNHLDGNALKAIADQQGWRLGIRFRRADRLPYDVTYRDRFPRRDESADGARGSDGDRDARVEHEPAAGDTVPAGPRFPHGVTRPLGVVLAGSAGERVQSAAAILCHAALASGLYCTQKNDYPVTVGSGFSLSEVTLSPEPILFTAIERPDAVLVTSADGLREVTGRGDLKRLAPDAVVIADETMASSLPPDRTLALPLRTKLTPKGAALGALATWLVRTQVIDAGAIDHAIGELGSDDAASLRATIRLARSL